MQVFSSILALAATLFMLVSAEQIAHRPSNMKPQQAVRKSRQSGHGARHSGHGARHSGRRSRGSNNWGWSSNTGCPASSSSGCGSSSSSSDCWDRRSPCAPYSPCGPPVSPLAPVTACDPLYGPGYGAFAGAPCGAPCGSPSPCGPMPYYRKDRASRQSQSKLRRFAADPARVIPWYVYLTATYTSTYSPTTTVSTSSTLSATTVSYQLFLAPAIPTEFGQLLN